MTIDPANGHILTMASSAKYQDSKFNIAADAKRQPGSTFKVIALVAALAKGISPSTTYASGAVQLGPQYGNVTINCYGGKCSGGGSKTLVAATTSSDNTVYIRLALDLGPKYVAATARKLGITSQLQGYPSETLGGLKECCSPLEMANAYATIASGGFRNKPKAVTEVIFPDRKVENVGKPQRVKAFDSAPMYEVTKILQANIKGGTGTKANIGCPAGGKTGTTEDNKNAWFVGYTPRLATAVWVGFPKANIPMGNLYHGGPVDGGTFPAEIWGIYMKAAKRSFCGEFSKPGHGFKSKSFSGKHSSGGSSDAVPVQSNNNGPATGKAKQGNGTTNGPTGGPAEPRPGGQVVAPPPPPRDRRHHRPRRAAGASIPTSTTPAPSTRRRSRSARPRTTARPERRFAGIATCRGAPRCYRAAPMAKEEKVEFEGEVIEALPNAMFRVKLDNEHVVLGHVAGKMRRFRIRILPGDRVRCELSPYDLDRARIVYRHR